jgi:hypothetical protein
VKFRRPVEIDPLLPFAVSQIGTIYATPLSTNNLLGGNKVRRRKPMKATIKISRCIQDFQDVSASADDYNELLDQLWAARADARSKYVKDIFVLRDNLTQDEWDTAFGYVDD